MGSCRILLLLLDLGKWVDELVFLIYPIMTIHVVELVPYMLREIQAIEARGCFVLRS